jgi:hypothetical protein
VRWRYTVSNAVALTQEDVRWMTPRDPWVPRLLRNEEGRPHTVRFPCAKLELVFEFAEDVVEVDSGRVIVERLSQEGAEERWVNVPEEEGRCTELRVTARSVHFRWRRLSRGAGTRRYFGFNNLGAGLGSLSSGGSTKIAASRRFWQASTHTWARALLHEGRLRLPNHPRLLQQLRDVVSKPTPGGGLSITSSRRAGTGHGDLVTAMVLAVYQRGGHEVPNPLPTPGSQAYYDAIATQIEAEMVARLERRRTAAWWEQEPTGTGTPWWRQ